MHSVARVIESGRRLRHATIEGLPMEAAWLLQNTQGGTRVIYLMDYQPSGGLIKRLWAGFRLHGEMSRMYAEGLSRLKVAIED